ncbi:MAG: endonuclease/exonuclease/phosphatase family protein [Ferruginibacter sp.]
MPANKLRRYTRKIFVLTNILFAVFFLVGCYASKFDSLRLWFLGLFSLAAFYFFLILIAFIFFWIFVKPVRALISIVAIAIGWLPLQHLVQARLTPNFTMEKHPENIRVMSWNVEHFEILYHKTNPEKKTQMLDMINQHQPDIACFQEMVGSENITDAINYIPDFLNKLGFKYYHYTYNPKLDFDGKHHFGIIIFSKYPIVNKHNVSYAPNDYNSIFQFADIVKGGDTIRIFNTHMQSLKFSEDNLHYIDDPSLKSTDDVRKSKNVLSRLKTGFIKRHRQSDRLKISMNQSPYPVIVCGDFNDVPNSYAYNTIGKGMKNTFKEKGTGIGRTFYGISPTLRIDHIFADPRFHVEQYLRIKKKLSDHFPIIADLYYKKP